MKKMVVHRETKPRQSSRKPALCRWLCGISVFDTVAAGFGNEEVQFQQMA
jgi:hypothetical protein